MKKYKVVSTVATTKQRLSKKFNHHDTAWSFYASCVADPSHCNVKFMHGKDVLDEYDDYYSDPDFLEQQELEAKVEA